MSHRRRSRLETAIQNEIELAIGAEPDLLLLRNSVGKATYVSPSSGREYHVPYGLGEGSPDLVGILRVDVASITVGIWLVLEVKPPEGELEPEQLKCHEVWRSFGVIVETVRSADEARAAVARARGLFKAVAA